MAKSIKEKELEKKKVISSATKVIRYILKIKDIELTHKKKILNEMIWAITEADGLTSKIRTGYKKRLTYISEGVNKIKYKKDEGVKGLIHEHVFRRKNLVQKLLDSPANIKKILSNAISCVVTQSENKQLSHNNTFGDGWSRYKKAKIKVFKRKYDLLTGRETYEPCSRGFKHS